MFLGVLVIFGGWSGCAARAPRPPAPPLGEAEALRLLEETAARAAGVRRYQGVVGVRGEGPEGRFSGRLLVVFARPPPSADAADPEAVEALRLELFAPVGGSRWTLVAGPGEVRLVVPPERAFVEGTALEEFTGPLLGVPVALEAVAALLVGSGTPLGGADGLRERPPGGSAVLRSGAEVWWDVDDSGAPTSSDQRPAPQVRRVRTPEYEARYPGDYRRRGRQVPREIEIASAEVRATLTVEELQVNAALHPESFQVRTPAGYRRAEVRDLERASRLPER